MWRYGKLLGLNKVWSLLSILFLVCNSYIVSWSMYGLETPLFLALMFWFFQLMQDYLKDNSRKNLVLLVVTGVAFAITRPEAPFYLLVSVFAVLFFTPPIADIRSRMFKSLLPGGITAGILVALLCARTRTSVNGFRKPIMQNAEQAPVCQTLTCSMPRRWHHKPDCNYYRRIVLNLAVNAEKRSNFTPYRYCLPFLCSNGHLRLDAQCRHALPVWVIVPLALAALGNTLWKQERARWVAKTAAVAIAVIMLATSVDLAKIDSHFSKYDVKTHGRGTEWKRPKTMERWQESYSCLKHEIPPRVKSWGIRGGGMIVQVWNVLEACTEPLDESWYIGRDIGRVGYLTDVNIFDTDGLFTPLVSHDPKWQKKPDRQKPISTKLVGKMFEKSVIGTEVYGNWRAPLGRQKKLLDNFEILNGSQKHPTRISRISCEEPTHKQLLHRYQTVFDRMPQGYYVATLYGDSVGAMIDRRYRHIMQTVETPPSGLSAKSAIPAQYPKDEVLQNISFDDVARLEFCHQLPKSVKASEGILIDCYYSPLKKPGQTLKSFVHLVKGGKIIARHIPLGTRHLPFTSWSPEVFGDQLYHQVFRLTLSPTIKPGEYQILFGWYNGDHRAVIDRPELTDKSGRIIVKKVNITT